MRVKLIEHVALDISPLRVLARAGYGKTTAVPEKEAQELEKILPQMLALCDPRIIFGELSVAARSDSHVELVGNVRLESAALARILRSAEIVTLYVATIGSGVEERSAVLSRGGCAREALLWDAFGSEAAEATARAVSRITRQRAKTAGMTTTNRFSPGYGDLKLEFNRVIVDLLGAERIGVSVNEFGMLLPRKTTTGIIGWHR